jgi:hypothetical protein
MSLFDIGLPVDRLGTAARDLEKLALTAATLATARKDAHTEPTDAQKDAGNYRKGHVRWKGFEITIENPKGSLRKGTSKDGKKWSVKMQYDYGYIRGTVGRDKDHVDIFLGPQLDSEVLYVVNQVDPGTGRFDEHKVIAGAISEAQAREIYLSNYEDGWQGLGSIKPMTLPDLKIWIYEGDLTKRAKTKVPVGRKPSVAVDLDGTLAEDWKKLGLKYDPEYIPAPRPGAKKWLKKFRELGCSIIIWTCRDVPRVIKAWLAEHEIPYDYVNENPDQPPDCSQKIFADVYWDDRGVSARGRLDDSGAAVVAALEHAKEEIANDDRESSDRAADVVESHGGARA